MSRELREPSSGAEREKSIPWQTENYQGHLRKFTVKDISPAPNRLRLVKKQISQI